MMLGTTRVLLECLVFFLISCFAVEIALSNYEDVINHSVVMDKFVSPRKARDARVARNVIRVSDYQVNQIKTVKTVKTVKTATILFYKDSDGAIITLLFSNSEMDILERLAIRLNNLNKFNSFILSCNNGKEGLMADAKTLLSNSDHLDNSDGIKLAITDHSGP